MIGDRHPRHNAGDGQVTQVRLQFARRVQRAPKDDPDVRAGQAVALAGSAPERVTTDGQTAYPQAIRETLGPGTTHRCGRYKNKSSSALGHFSTRP